ncbi:NADP(H)-dependent aldo-keto reductase [Robertkochia sediminum]|uniref:NADP(H)-dependent aldo-keto reductase n=1 Tax=Robertkochia sediminum TaxID=2785326 RepID=UPI001933F19A|nr:NADP(H)-dependent aldo-keto reductase [Robertkochia sediminum]MBL7471944.1 NADP(H)-dependent aldo-keto reductase [Robertkochia sediminum]
MKYTLLPHTDIKVSKICLGTMTWGQQNTEAEGHAQMDYAFDQGVNFFDTAELYPVPAKAETQGETERVIGTWFKKNGNREQVVLASKIAGPAAFTQHIRTGGFKKEEIEDAIHKSLKRLQTDYIDLYQLHWPERNTNYFGSRGYIHDEQEQWEDNFRTVLESLEDFVKQGKIRQVGLSNENPFGVMRYLEEHRNHDLPRMITIQNPYNLLNRLFEGGNAEVSMREGVGLLAYSPLGFGTLSGKYLGGKMPEGSRIKLFPNYNRYIKPQGVKATEKYAALAEANGLSLTHMALAFVNAQPFVTSNIIGATRLDQLKENISSIDVELSQEVLDAINEIHNEIPNPAP